MEVVSGAFSPTFVESLPVREEGAVIEILLNLKRSSRNGNTYIEGCERHTQRE